MLLYLYGKGEALIQHFLIKSFKMLQIVTSHYPYVEQKFVLCYGSDKNPKRKSREMTLLSHFSA